MRAFLAFWLFAVSTLVIAQTPPAPALDTAADRLAADLAAQTDWYLSNQVEPAQFDPSFRQPTAANSAGLAFKLEANSNDKSASLKFSIDLPAADSEKSPFSLAFKLTSPLSEDSSRTTIATADTFVGLPSGEVGIFWSDRRRKTTQVLRDGTGPYLKNWLAGPGTASTVADRERRAVISAAVSQAVPDIEALRSAVEFNDVARFAGSPWMHFAGLSAKGGRKSYSFVEIPNLKSSKVASTSYSVGVAAGMYQTAMENFYTISVERVRKYKEQDLAQKCTDGPAAGLQTCKSVHPGAPSRQQSTVAELSANLRFASQFGITPTITRDATAKETAISLPIYFIEGTAGDEKHALNGGISLDWDSKSHDVVVSVFVGQFAKKPAFLGGK